MALFMDVHTGMKGITLDELRKEHQKDIAAQGKEHVKFLKAWADPKSGKVFCLSEGPNRAAVERVHNKAGHPADELYELTVAVE